MNPMSARFTSHNGELHIIGVGHDIRLCYAILNYELNYALPSDKYDFRLRIK
jgi:hypothetical protein